MSKRIDMTGQKYGRLTAIELDRIENNHTFWKCQCDCGNVAIIDGAKLRNGHTKSCGCFKLENVRRQRKQNEYEIVEGYVKVKLNDENYMLCDIDDWEKLKRHYWNICPTGYAAAGTTAGGRMFFHKEVTNTTSEIIDHINMNKLDNRKCNLRIADKKINSINRDLQSNNTTGHKGIYFDKRYGTWNARVTVNRKTIHLGTYSTKEQAIAARIKGEEKYYKPQLERSSTKTTG